MISKIVGFAVSTKQRADVDAASDRILARFPWLERSRVDAGGHHITLWGHGNSAPFVHTHRDGSVWIAVSSNVPPVWRSVVSAYDDDADSVPLGAGLDGIFVLLRLAPGTLEIWNDWTGATKVFTWCGDGEALATTLEPVAVAASGVGQRDVRPASAYALLRFGSFVGTSTLYTPIRTIAPDQHATVDTGGVRSRWMRSVTPSTARWEAGWDDVIEEWKALFDAEIGAALSVAPRSTLMLSGGIDSRLIAALGSRLGHAFDAVSYGNRIWQDGVFSAQVARTLDLPYTSYDIADDYLTRHTRAWCDWFGASMCVHGMYQMPGLDALRRDGRTAPITTGFAGDPLEGMQVAMLMRRVPESRSPFLDRVLGASELVAHDTIGRLAPWLDVESAREELEQELSDAYARCEGAEFQRMWLLFQWNRVFTFSSYQPTMYDYYAGVITPFVRRALAQFTLSLPRYALEGRRTVYELIKRHLPAMARLPGTYAHPSQTFDFIPKNYGIPLLLTKRYLAEAALGYALPERLRRGPLRQFGPGLNVFARDALRANGLRALYPLDEIEVEQQSIFEPGALRAHVDEVLRDDGLYASSRLWAVQTLLHRLQARRA